MPNYDHPQFNNSTSFYKKESEADLKKYLDPFFPKVIEYFYAVQSLEEKKAQKRTKPGYQFDTGAVADVFKLRKDLLDNYKKEASNPDLGLSEKEVEDRFKKFDEVLQKCAPTSNDYNIDPIFKMDAYVEAYGDDQAKAYYAFYKGYKALQNSCDAYTKKVGDLQTIERVIDNEAKQQLLEGYVGLQTSIENYRTFLNSNRCSLGSSDKKNQLDSLNALSEIAKQHVFALDNYSPEKGYLSLNGIFENSKPIEVDITGFDTGVASGQQSSRIPFFYTSPEGKKYDGYFTPKLELNLADDYQKGMDKLVKELEKANLGSVATIFASIMDRYVESQLPSKDADEATKNALREKFATELGAEEFNAHESLYDPVEAVVEKYCTEDEKIMLQETIANLDPHKMDPYRAFASLVNGIQNRKALHDMAGIKPHSRIDSRNAALSSMAGMLGVKDLVAKSVPMTIIQNGKKIEGTFMETAKGLDVNHANSSDSKYRYTNVDYSDGLKSLLDLQALDYICGNIDRHGANFIYQFDKDTGKLNKVVGIDNDLSFGTFTQTTEKKGIQKLVHPSDMFVISQFMANSISQLTKEKIEVSLGACGLSQEQLDACWERTKIFQDYITNAHQVPKRDDKKLNLFIGKLNIIQDDEVKKYSTIELNARFLENQLMQKKIQKIMDKNGMVKPDFKIIGKELKIDPRQVKIHYQMKPEFNIMQLTQLLNDQLVDTKGNYKTDVTKSIYPFDAKAIKQKFFATKDKVKDMDAHTINGKTSKEYETLKAKIKEYSEFCETRYDHMLGEGEIIMHDQLVAEMLDAGNKYLVHADNKIFKSDYAKERRTFVQGIVNDIQKLRILPVDKDKRKEMLHTVHQFEEKEMARQAAEIKAKSMEAMLIGAMEATVQQMEMSKTGEGTYDRGTFEIAYSEHKYYEKVLHDLANNDHKVTLNQAEKIIKDSLRDSHQNSAKELDMREFIPEASSIYAQGKCDKTIQECKARVEKMLPKKETKLEKAEEIKEAKKEKKKEPTTKVKKHTPIRK